MARLVYIYACLIVAAIVGWLTRSLAMFVAELAVTLGRGRDSGDIRPTSSRR